MSNRDASAEQEVSRGLELVESMNAITILVQTSVYDLYYFYDC